MSDVIEQAISIDMLRRMLNDWDHYHHAQLELERVHERTRAREQRDAIEKELNHFGFQPCYVDNQLMLIVH